MSLARVLIHSLITENYQPAGALVHPWGIFVNSGAELKTGTMKEKMLHNSM